MEAFLIQLVALLLIIKGIIGLVNPAWLFKVAASFQKKKSLVRIVSILSIVIGVILL